MTSVIGLAVLLLSAVFALVYVPLLTKFSGTLVSSYPKADVKRRLIAAAVDGLLCATCVALYVGTTSVPFLLLGAGYALVRDAAIPGRSIGKLLAGLTVIQLEGGRPCTLSRSVQRNLVFVVPGANLVAVVLETYTFTRDGQGLRLGDRLAQTQVVVGKDAKELVRAVQQRLLGHLAKAQRIRRLGEKPTRDEACVAGRGPSARGCTRLPPSSPSNKTNAPAGRVR